jgi:hypothetical protein
MKPFVLSIAEYVQANTDLVLGDSITVGELQRGKNGIYIVPISGTEPDRYTDTKYFVLDFWAKYKKSSEAYETLGDIYTLFHQAHHYTVGAYNVYYSNALGQISDLDRDFEENKLLRLSLNYIVK